MSDPVSAGASVLTFVLLGLKSAKAAYEILSSFKEGPENVKTARTDVESLVLVLDKLSNCRLLERTGSEALRTAIDSCLDDIQSFTEKLKRLAPEANSSCRSIYRKRFMAAWDEKALLKIRVRLANHTSALNFHLSVLQSDAVVAVPEQLQSISQELTAQRTAHDTHHAEQKTQTSTTLRVVEGGIASLEGRLEMMQETVQTLSSTSAASRLESRGLQEQLHGEICGLVERNHLEVRGLFDRIWQDLARTSLADSDLNSVVEVQDEKVTDGFSDGDEQAYSKMTKPCKELMNVITRLCRSLDDVQPQGRVMVKDIRDITSDILRAFKLMSSEEFLQTEVMSDLNAKGICAACRDCHFDRLRESLTTIHLALSFARRLMVNDTRRAQVQERMSGPRYHNHSTTLSAYETSMGSLIILSRRKLRTQGLLQSDQSEPPNLAQLEGEGEDEEDVTTSVTLVSRLPQARRAISINTRETYTYNGVHSGIPHLLVYNILPAYSPIFSIVQDGRLREFQALLHEGKASLRDQDEYGAPLLFYATKQPEMCRYLIQCGADVDYIARHQGVMRGFYKPKIGSAFAMHINDQEAGDSLEPILVCRKLLLEAGCDPTIPTIYDGITGGDQFSGVLGDAVPEAVQIVLDFGSPFVDANTKLAGSETAPLAIVCEWGRFSPEILTVLLQRNANVGKRDGWGRTCLHHCLAPACRWGNGLMYFGRSNWIHRISRGIILLIEHGADVYAEDGIGNSVSDTAYARHTDARKEKRFGCVRGDVWDFALTTCGYNILDFRQGRIRKARYGEIYTRHDFEKLWAGQERLCPYYDAEENCHPDTYASSCTNEDSEDQWMTTDSEDETMGVDGSGDV